MPKRRGRPSKVYRTETEKEAFGERFFTKHSSLVLKSIKANYPRLSDAEAKNLFIKQGEACEIIVDNNIVTDVKTKQGNTYNCKCAIICSGVYLKSRIIIGEYSKDVGPNGFANATGWKNKCRGHDETLRNFKL